MSDSFNIFPPRSIFPTLIPLSPGIVNLNVILFLHSRLSPHPQIVPVRLLLAMHITGKVIGKRLVPQAEERNGHRH